MSAQEIIDTLHQLGVELRVNGDRLRIGGSARLITPELKSAIAEQKSAIIETLRTQKVGSIYRPIPIQFNKTPRYCPMDRCLDGELQVRGPLFICSCCGCWYSLSGALSEDMQVALDERAAIREFDGGQDRTAAEIGAAVEFSGGRQVFKS